MGGGQQRHDGDDRHEATDEDEYPRQHRYRELPGSRRQEHAEESERRAAKELARAWACR